METINDIDKIIESKREELLKIESEKTFKRLRNNYIGSVLAIITGGTTIVLGIFGLLSIEFENGFGWKSLFFVAVVIILTSLIVHLFNKQLIDRISSHIASNHVSFIETQKTLSESFKVLNNKTNELNDRLEFLNSLQNEFKGHSNDFNITHKGFTQELELIKKISSDLGKTTFKHLISWKDIVNIEKRAKKVWAISYTLMWLDNKRIDEILIELKDNEDCEYHFIVLDKNKAKKRINAVIERKEAFAKENSDIHFKDRFYILFSDNNIEVPIPNDVVIYKNIDGNDKKNLAVINTKDMGNIQYDENGDIPDSVLHSNFDLAFRESVYFERIEDWFLNTWELLKIEQKKKINDRN